MANAVYNPEIRRRATLIGAGAVFLRGSLAILTTLSGSVPPSQIVAIAVAIVFLIALTRWILRGERMLEHFRQPGRAWWHRLFRPTAVDWPADRSWAGVIDHNRRYRRRHEPWGAFLATGDIFR